MKVIRIHKVKCISKGSTNVNTNDTNITKEAKEAITNTIPEYLRKIFVDNGGKTTSSWCRPCPFCGETKCREEYAMNGIENKGVEAGGLSVTKGTGFLGLVIKTFTPYKCHTCGAYWEVEE